MPARLTFKEALARRDETPAVHRTVSGSPVRLLLSTKGPIDRPVSAIQLIAHLGTSLRRGHDTLDRIAKGESVPVELIVPEGCDVSTEFAELNILAQVIARPFVDVRSIRERLDLTQAEFAIRFGLELDTLRNWEQGRNSPDPTATILLKIIEQNPEAVDAVLAGTTAAA